MPLPLLFTEETEQVPADEEGDIARTVAILRQTLQRQLERSGQARRDVHVKSHGCAAAEFRVRSGLPTELAQGLFAEPKTYSAFIRFSNSAPWPQPDALPDGRGLALQIEHDSPTSGQGEAARQTQDFVLVNHPTFIARDVKDYLRLQEARLEASRQPMRVASKLLAAASNPLHWRWRAILAAAQVAAQPPSHPANYTYYSMAPFRYGRHIAKFRVAPIELQRSSWLQTLSTFGQHTDGMRLLLEETLARRGIEFDFQVQLRTSEQSMPIEDATVEWPQSESPYQSVAELIIPRQDISPLRSNGEAERRAFNVWNALVEHRPLGGINRVRRQAYAVSSDFRNARKPC